MKYIEKVIDKQTKNHRVGNKNEDGGVIKECSGDFCLVKAFKLYLSQLNPNVDAFFNVQSRISHKKGPGKMLAWSVLTKFNSL